MSTAKVPQSDPALTPADFADILSTTLEMAAEAGLSVAIRSAEATPLRPAGLMIFVSGLTAQDGRIVVLQLTETAPS